MRRDWDLSLDAMQLNSPSLITLHDLLDDMLKIIVPLLSYVDETGWGKGRDDSISSFSALWG